MTPGHFNHTSSFSSVDTHPRVALKLDNRCLMSCFFHDNKCFSLNSQSQLHLNNIKVRKSTSEMQPSRTFMIYEVWIEARISPRATESQTYMSQLKSTAGKRRARRANGSVLLRNCTEAVLPAATRNNSVVFSRNEQVRAKTACGRSKTMDVVDEHHCSYRQGVPALLINSVITVLYAVRHRT